MSNAAVDILSAREVPRAVKPAVVKVTTSSSTAGHKAAEALDIIHSWQKSHSLTATRCTCCGAKLTDAVSVNRGMGPICSKEHYELDFPITTTMIEEALGLLHASGLDKLVKRAAKALKQKPRDLCNVLVWWASAHLDETDVVLDCAAVVTALGFESLGARVRERNTNVIISVSPTDPDHFILRCRSTLNVRRNMRRVKEAVPLPREGRFKYGWKVQNTRTNLVRVILGEDFGDQWATVPGTGTASKVVRIPETTWRDVRAALQANYPQPRRLAPKALIVRPGQPGWLEIHTPHRHFGFVGEFKATINYRDRTWNGKCWTVRARHEGVTRQLVAKHFNGAL